MLEQSRECRHEQLHCCSQLIPPIATVALVIHITIYCLLPCLSSEASPRVITLVEDMGSKITEHSQLLCRVTAQSVVFVL